jgi:hypothetical protein
MTFADLGILFPLFICVPVGGWNIETVTMRRLRRPFRLLAIICLLIGVMPYWRHVTLRGLPDGKSETKNVITIGISLSPLLILERSRSEQVRGTEITASDSKGFKLEFVSWSMLALVLGALFFMADRWWGRSPNSSPG